MSEEPSTPVESGTADPEREIVLSLPESLRSALKEPFGPVRTDADSLLAEAGDPLIAVGDIVTYHLLEAGRPPDVSLIDERTERSAVDAGIRERIVEDEGWFEYRVQVDNPAGTVTAALLGALVEALDRDEPSTIVVVDGEEDLATLPAMVVAPPGASVVYGQPGEGMVHVAVDTETSERARSILSRMDGDHARAWKLLGV
ncbi:GTP-dependent dephospho-CoA kinase family protein [Halorhabdus utahensis]|uniref:GTP-dependent dephospho-CoA kinase family protein n=1 Tax=Halorhabdus utahensis TaxID=146826 RepID=UPI00019BCF6F|nr:GTP-dependent dephospho-CoA kinase family protein [Halorhabdus utahensis]